MGFVRLCEDLIHDVGENVAGVVVIDSAGVSRRTLSGIATWCCLGLWGGLKLAVRWVLGGGDHSLDRWGEGGEVDAFYRSFVFFQVRSASEDG